MQNTRDGHFRSDNVSLQAARAYTQKRKIMMRIGILSFAQNFMIGIGINTRKTLTWYFQGIKYIYRMSHW